MANKKPTREKTLKEIIKEEYARCFKDPVYFMKRYCTIQHPMRGRINFNLYPFQEELLTDFKKHQFKIIKKGRQLGISTLCAAYSLWRMTFREDFSVLVIATRQEVAKNLVTKVVVMHEGLPTWLKVPTVENNRLSLRFKNGSQIKAVSSRPESARSEALSLLIIDEAAHIKSSLAEEIWTSAQQTLATGGEGIILSSPNGVGNFFHKKWVQAETEGTMFAINLPWSVHPERDENWREEQGKLLGAQKAAQELDADFLASGNTVVDSDILLWYQETFIQDPMEKRGVNQDLWIWKYPDYTREYLIAADVARGDGFDYSAAQVFDVETLEQVAEYKGKMDTVAFGNFLYGLGSDYNNALIAVDNAGVGWSTIQVLLDRRYQNLYYSQRNMNYVDETYHLSKSYDAQDKDGLLAGFTLSPRNRPLIIAKLYDLMKDRLVILRSQRTLDELFTFVWINSKPIALDNYNDDLVLSLGIVLWVRDTAIRLRQLGINLTKVILSNVSRPVISTKTDLNTKAQKQWTMKAAGKTIDLRKYIK